MIGVLFLAAALFWSVFEQAGSTLNLFADRNTHNSMLGWSFPSSWFQSLNSLFIIVFAPMFAWLWVRLGTQRQASLARRKFAFGSDRRRRSASPCWFRRAMAATGTLVSPMWLIADLPASHVRRAVR